MLPQKWRPGVHVLACSFAIGLSTCAAQAADVPVADRVAKELAAYYRDNGEPDYKRAIAELASGDPVQRHDAGEYLHRLVEALWADRTAKGRPARQVLDDEDATKNFFPAGSMLNSIATSLGESAQGDDALDAVRSLLYQEPFSPADPVVFQVIARTHTRRADEMIIAILEHPEANEDLVLSALAEAMERALPVQEAVRRLAGSFRDDIRRAARKAAADMKLGSLPPYVPARAFTPELHTMLTNIAGMIPDALPPEAKWVRVTQREPGRHEDTFSACLIERQGRRQTAVDQHGLTVLIYPGKIPANAQRPVVDDYLDYGYCSIAPRTLQQDAKLFAAIRADEKRFAAGGGLFPGYRLRGYFEGDVAEAITKPEALLAAWSYQRGNPAVCASVLFPRLQDADLRYFEWIVAGLLGRQCHARVVDEFTHRHYAEALRLATHLSQPAFREYEHQGAAQELARQLAELGDEFQKLKLPTAEEWTVLKASLDRPGQMRFLAERVRLLCCRPREDQSGYTDYGKVNYADPQFARVWQAAGKEQMEGPVINPYVELRNLKLNPGELSVLIPFLADEHFTHTVSERAYPLIEYPGLHRVNQVIAKVIDAAAHRELVKLKTFDLLDEKARQEHLAQLQAWSKANGDKSAGDLILETLQNAPAKREFEVAAVEAMRGKLARAVPVMAARVRDFDEFTRETIGAICGELPGPEMIAVAQDWMKSDDHNLRFWGALALVRHGDEAQRRAAVEVLTPLLVKDESLYGPRFPQAYGPLVAAHTEETLHLACLGVLAQKELNWDEQTMLLQLLQLGRTEIYEALLQRLEDDTTVLYEGYSTNGMGGKPVHYRTSVADVAAGLLTNFEGPELRYRAGEAVRKKFLQDAKAWLRANFAKFQAGTGPRVKARSPINVRNPIDETLLE